MHSCNLTETVKHCPYNYNHQKLIEKSAIGIVEVITDIKTIRTVKRDSWLQLRSQSFVEFSMGFVLVLPGREFPRKKLFEETYTLKSHRAINIIDLNVEAVLVQVACSMSDLILPNGPWETHDTFRPHQLIPEIQSVLCSISPLWLPKLFFYRWARTRFPDPPKNWCSQVNMTLNTW